MKLTNEKILSFSNSMVASKKLPVKLAFAISVNASAVAPALEAYHRQRKALLEKYAEKAGDEFVIENGRYKIEDEKGWSQEIQELLETESDVTIATVPVDVLEKCDTDAFDSLTVKELLEINFMIE